MSERTRIKVRARPGALAAILDGVWAIDPSKLEAIVDFGISAAEGIEIDSEAVRPSAARTSLASRAGSVAVLPLLGSIFDRANMFSDISGGTSLSKWIGEFRAAVNDSAVSSIVLDVDSPGGQVAGVQEVADEIFASRAKKPIVAVANKFMASAAYWLGSQASELVVSPSAEVGSIGVYQVHYDMTSMNEKAGVKPTFISAGKFKTTGHSDRALDEEGAALLQARVDEAYSAFVSAVARGRNSSAAAVRAGFGQGFMVSAKEAVRIGMADRVATLEQTVARQGASASKRSGAMAALSALEF